MRFTFAGQKFDQIRALTQFRGFVKKPAVRRQSVSVGHSGNIIADGSRLGLIAAAGGLSPFFRHQERLLEKALEKPAHHGVGLGADAHDARLAIHIQKQKIFDVAVCGAHIWRKADHGLSGLSYIDRAGGVNAFQLSAGIVDYIFNKARDQPAAKFMDNARALKTWMQLRNFRQRFPQKRHAVERFEIKQPCPQTVIEIMRIIGDIVGNGSDLRFGARI